MDIKQYQTNIAETRKERIGWWQEARFGMFIHWGLYAQLGRHEWVMNRERIPVGEYEKLAETWFPKERPAREWAALAKKAGMKYMVMTTKHHEGFCLWDTEQTHYNAMRMGPGRDLVREYVEACREYDLKIGFYYSLMDWHHPDGVRCAKDESARRRFLDFTQGCVRELMTNYGKIDILWYDVSWPLPDAVAWESVKMTQMARDLQPHIIVNNRAKLDEDFGTPEETVKAAETGRAWEACMTFNGSWGYMPISPDWRSAREVVEMLRTATAGQGNLLLNIGPTPDGSVPEEAETRLNTVGQWVRLNSEALYGQVDRAERDRLEWMPTGAWTLKGNTGYFWCTRWPGRELVIGGLLTKAKKVSLLANKQPIDFDQTANRLVLKNLPYHCPDPYVGITVLKIEFENPPIQKLGAGYEVLEL
jgi:alpha-L-fucosidase